MTPIALRPLQELEDHRRAADLCGWPAHVLAAAGEGGRRNADAVAREELQAAQLVAAAARSPGSRWRGRPPSSRTGAAPQAVEGDRGADPGTTPSTPGHPFAVVEHLRPLLRHLDARSCSGSSTATSAPRWRQASIRREVEYSVALRDRMAIFIGVARVSRGCHLRSRYLPETSTRKSPSRALRPRIIRNSMPERLVKVTRIFLRTGPSTISSRSPAAPPDAPRSRPPASAAAPAPRPAPASPAGGGRGGSRSPPARSRPAEPPAPGWNRRAASRCGRRCPPWPSGGRPRARGDPGTPSSRRSGLPRNSDSSHLPPERTRPM